MMLTIFFELLREFISTFRKRFTFFGQNSSVHGVKYVFDNNGSKMSRFIWLLILLLSMGCLYFLLMPVVQRAGSVSFTSDTRYLHWSTTFPAVTVCETYNPKAVQKNLMENYPDLLEPLDFDFRRYVTDLLFGRGTCSRALCVPCGTTVPCGVPWRDIVGNVHKKCRELIADCHFNNKEFSCCKQFRMVDSEYGPCYSFNSLQNSYNNEAQFAVNRSTGPGFLSFYLISDAQVSVHSPEELSTNYLDKKFRFDINTNAENYVDFLFSIVEVNNENQLENEDIFVRKCRYNHEIPNEPLHIYPVYSYGACRLARATAQSYNHCKCVHPVRDLSYKDKYCNYTGLNCLVAYEVQKVKLGTEDSQNTDDCLPSCVESELSTIDLSKRTELKNHYEGTLVNIRMVSLPTLRYQKNLMRTNLDFVVTVGGMVGLFFSASILSLVEFFYLMLRLQ